MPVVVVDPEAAVGGGRVAVASVPPVPAVPAAVLVVAVDVVADQRVGDAVENVGEERIRRGKRRRSRHEGRKRGAQHKLSSCQHGVSLTKTESLLEPDDLIVLNGCSGFYVSYISSSFLTQTPTSPSDEAGVSNVFLTPAGEKRAKLTLRPSGEG